MLDFTGELLLARGEGSWDFGEFRSNVFGRSPLIVIVESALRGVSGGFAALPFQGEGFIADPTGASSVFSLWPAMRHQLYPGIAKALHVIEPSVGIGIFCLGIENTYAVPSGWETPDFVKVRRFEIWRVAL